MVGGYTPPPPQPAVLPRLVVDGEPPQLLKLKTGRRNKRNLLRYFSVRGSSFLLIISTHPTEIIFRGCFVGLVSGNSSPERTSPNSSTQTHPTKTSSTSSFNSSDTDVLNFKTSSTHPTRVSSTHLPKTHSRHLQLISQRRTQLLFSSSSQDVFAG